MRVLAAGWHPGSVNAIAPVVHELKRRGAQVRIVAYGVGDSIFRKHKLQADIVLEKVDPKVAMQLLREERPTSLLCGASAPDSSNPLCLEQELVGAAREMGIRSVSVLDFWSNYLKRVSRLDVSVTPPRIVEPFAFMPDVMCVMDGNALAEMVKEGFDPARVAITGNPEYAAVAAKRAPLAGSGTPRMLFCSQPIELNYGDSYGFTEKTALRSLLEALSLIARESGSAFSLTVRKHPREGEIDLSWFSDPRVRVERDDKADLHGAILGSGIVFGVFSTVLIEARLLGRHSISVQIGRKEGSPEHLITNRFGITSLALTEVELGHLIRKALDGTLVQKDMNVPDGCEDLIIRQLA